MFVTKRNMIKIDQKNIVHYGRGYSLPLPKVFIHDNKLDHGESMNIYRDTVNGKDVLILIPANGALPSSSNITNGNKKIL